MSEILRILDAASDRYGNPFLIGFMEKYEIRGLIECFIEPERYIPLAIEYIRQEGLA